MSPVVITSSDYYESYEFSYFVYRVLEPKGYRKSPDFLSNAVIIWLRWQDYCMPVSVCPVWTWLSSFVAVHVRSLGFWVVISKGRALFTQWRGATSQKSGDLDFPNLMFRSLKEPRLVRGTGFSLLKTGSIVWHSPQNFVFHLCVVCLL
jgi:hypothetical protein